MDMENFDGIMTINMKDNFLRIKNMGMADIILMLVIII
jgi:hypothetical protein